MTQGTSKTNVTTKEQKKVMNRWIVVIGAIMIQLALGAIYAWSAFTTPLQGTEGILSEFAFSKTETQAIFSAGLATFAIFTIVGGRLSKKYGPRNIAILGGIFLGLGYIIAGLVGANFPLKLVGIGIIAGAGIGLSYVVPIAVGVKWFPDKKGLVSGLAVAGFGLGAFIWILLAHPPSLLGFNGLIQLQNGMYTVANVDQTFIFYGIAFLILVLIGSLVMVNPPKGWLPKGFIPAQEKKDEKGKIINSATPKEMLSSRQFYLLWTMFFIGALAGLMVIGNIQNFAKSATDGFATHGFTVTAAADFAVIGAAICLPIFNGIGRIAWGQISDKIGRRKALMTMCIFQGIMMLAFLYTTVNPYAFYVAAALIGFNFGANFALFPAATADTFGSENVGLNYGYVFTSYGIGGIVGPILAGIVQDAGLGFMYAFIPAALMCFFAAFLAVLYKESSE
ncbi:MAG: OFA family MFS transporter [Candidatus Thermoplasmatota archaeon]|nr:OFA family MFS transporter [Candidatus Thermoplasmatota archaeon]MBU1941757.1 OFA family MFS transporter [Candidatus Thermoplasmatota archaeon]